MSCGRHAPINPRTTYIQPPSHSVTPTSPTRGRPAQRIPPPSQNRGRRTPPKRKGGREGQRDDASRRGPTESPTRLRNAPSAHPATRALRQNPASTPTRLPPSASSAPKRTPRPLYPKRKRSLMDTRPAHQHANAPSAASTLTPRQRAFRGNMPASFHRLPAARLGQLHYNRGRERAGTSASAQSAQQTAKEHA